MAITDLDRKTTEACFKLESEVQPRAVRARYDRRARRVVVNLDNGLDFAFPPRLAEGLDDATPGEPGEIQISPAVLGLHWPKLDADLYIPSLLAGVLGSKRWMAAQLGAAGGRVRSEAKAGSSRENGRKGGRPRKVVAS